MGKPEETENSEEEETKEREEDEGNVLVFLDSVDSYLTLMDSLSSSLRQGWLELASARHSMGASRISSALFDLKPHSAAATLHRTDIDEQSPQFELHKWTCPDDGKDGAEEAELKEGDMQKRSDSTQLEEENSAETPGDKSPRTPRSPSADNQVQKERSKSLSMFGTLVSPKLRTAQLSFETALERLVQVANTRSSMLQAFDKVQKEMEGIKQ